jgi:hypothetical protein
MEEHVRMWNPEYRRPEVLSLDCEKYGWHII